jgi:Domain of unknown function (DUF4760)
MWQLLADNSKQIMALVSVLGLFSLVLIWYQIRKTRLWNILHFTYTFFPNPMEFEKEQDFLKSIIKSWRDYEHFSDLEIKALLEPETLTDEEKATIKNNFTFETTDVITSLKTANRKLVANLNQIELYCAAIKTGVVDSDTAAAHYDFKFTSIFHTVNPWIKKMRESRKEPEIFIEFEKIIDDWNPKKKQKKMY